VASHQHDVLNGCASKLAHAQNLERAPSGGARS
jgi:hypothetical protein